MIDIVNLSKIIQSQNNIDLEKLVNVINKLEIIQNIDDLSQSNLNGKTFEEVLKEVLSKFIEQNETSQSDTAFEDYSKFSVKNNKNNKEEISNFIKSEQNNVFKNVSQNTQNIRESSTLNIKPPEQLYEIEKGQNTQDTQDIQDTQNTQNQENIKEIVSRTTEDKEKTIKTSTKSVNSVNSHTFNKTEITKNERLIPNIKENSSENNPKNSINKADKIDEKLKDTAETLISKKNVALPKQNLDNSNNKNNTNNVVNVVNVVEKTINNKDNTRQPNVFQISRNNAYSRYNPYNPYNPYNSNRNVENTTAYANTNNTTSKSSLTNQLINQTNPKDQINKINKTKEINEYADSDNLKKQLSENVLNTVNISANNTKNSVEKEHELKTDNSFSKKINLESNKNITGKDNNLGNFGDLSKLIDSLSIAVFSFTGSVNTRNYSSDTNTKDFKLQNSSEKEIKFNNASSVNIQKTANNINTALISGKKIPINEVDEMKSEVKQSLTKFQTALANQNLSQMTSEKLEKSETNFMSLGTTTKTQKNNSSITLSTALDNIIFRLKTPNNLTSVAENLNSNLDNNLGKYVAKRIFDENLFEEGSQNSFTDKDLMIILKNISISITALSTGAISNYIESIENNKKDYKNLQNLQQMNRLSNTSNVGNIIDVANNDSDISPNLSLNSSRSISSQQLNESRNESEFLSESNHKSQKSQKQNSFGQFRNDSSESQKNNIEVKSFKIEYREIEKNNSSNQSQELNKSDEKTEKPKVSNKFIERLAEITYKGSRNEVINTTVLDSGKYDLAERLQASRNLENLYEKIKEFNLSNKIEERVQMKLLPENLGMLDVEMKKEGRQLTILFLTENEKAKEMLEKNIYILRDRLNNFDMDVRSIEVRVREEEKFYEQDRQQNNNQNNQKEEHKHNGNNENKKRFASEGVNADDDERERNL